MTNNFDNNNEWPTVRVYECPKGEPASTLTANLVFNVSRLETAIMLANSFALSHSTTHIIEVEYPKMTQRIWIRPDEALATIKAANEASKPAAINKAA